MNFCGSCGFCTRTVVRKGGLVYACTNVECKLEIDAPNNLCSVWTRDADGSAQAARRALLDIGPDLVHDKTLAQSNDAPCPHKSCGGNEAVFCMVPHSDTTYHGTMRLLFVCRRCRGHWIQ